LNEAQASAQVRSLEAELIISESYQLYPQVQPVVGKLAAPFVANEIVASLKSLTD